MSRAWAAVATSAAAPANISRRTVRRGLMDHPPKRGANIDASGPREEGAPLGGRIDQPGHGVEGGDEGAAPCLGQADLGQWLLANEALGDGDIAGLFQLAQMHREVAVGGLELGLQ